LKTYALAGCGATWRPFYAKGYGCESSRAHPTRPTHDRKRARTPEPTRPAAYCASRACTPFTAPAIIRFSAAIDSPPSSFGGIVAKPMADALG